MSETNAKMEFMVNGKKYSIVSDLHTHTVFSHGKGTIADNVRVAHSKGLKTIGISDHGPSHLGFGISKKDIPVMRAEVERLRKIYPDIEILLGVEANIMNRSGELDLGPEELSQFDYVMAGYHYGALGRNPFGTLFNAAHNLAVYKLKREPKHLIRRNTEYIVSALEKNDIKILTHPGDKAPMDLLEIAIVCAKTNTLVEINTQHMSLNVEDLKTMALADVQFYIGSDAHVPNRVGDFVAAIHLILDSGIDIDRVLNIQVA
ncbi:MAG: PHP domain-containing protein [Clostridiales Family XIII bacterium]|jgi:putative hydrolase|nr:PHP domain-containing protein [Clostridiales Family XIII bacterium]